MTGVKAKKAAKKSEVPARAKPRAKSVGQDDAAKRRAVLERALAHADKEGFTDAVLARAAKEEGIGAEDRARLFPEGALSLIAEFSAACDAEMEERLAKLDLAAHKVRERIALAVKTRIATLRPHKDAARRAAAALTLPLHAGLGMKLLYRSVDTMWRAAGDTSTDFNFYTKRAILAGVYSATLLRWFNDKSKDEKATEEFLRDRIENVMQFEKFKAEVKKGFSGLPSFGETLRGAMRK